jgi:hypothetical protein
MASVRVRLDDYVAGAMPDVSALSGTPTAERVVVTDEVVPVHLGTGLIIPALLHRFEQLLRPSAPRIVLRGRVPMLADEAARLHRLRRWWRAARWLAVLVLVGAAWSAAPVAPLAATVAVIGLAVSTLALRSLLRRWPRARPEPDQTWVVLDRIHETFATAVTAQSGAEVGEP